jgi:DNA-binding transcriptional LysR family regulator
MLDPRRVLVFRAVVEAGSFSGAAQELHLSQPSVSRAVAALERAAGVQLLIRRRDGLVLTEPGARLLERAHVVAGQLERAAEELDALRRLDAGRVSLGAFPTAARTVAVEALRAVHAAHPGLRVELREVAGAEGARLVAAAALDVALGFDLHGEAAPLERDLARTPLLTEPLYLAVPPEHRLARRRRVRLADLRDEDWIQGAGESPRLVERAARRAGFAPRIVAEADGTQALVAAGIGVTLLPALARAGARGDIAIVALADPPQRDVYAIAPARLRPPAVTALLDALRRACARRR